MSVSVIHKKSYAGWEISMSQPGHFFAIFQSYVPLVYSFVHNFVGEPEAICFSAGVKALDAPTYFPAWMGEHIDLCWHIQVSLKYFKIWLKLHIIPLITWISWLAFTFVIIHQINAPSTILTWVTDTFIYLLCTFWASKSSRTDAKELTVPSVQTGSVILAWWWWTGIEEYFTLETTKTWCTVALVAIDNIYTCTCF